MTTRNYYDILQVTSDADPDVIAAAYKRLAFKYHPDRNSDAAAHVTMRMLNEAYEVLSDPQRRKEYDSWCQQEQANHTASDPLGTSHTEAEKYEGTVRGPQEESKRVKEGWGVWGLIVVLAIIFSKIFFKSSERPALHAGPPDNTTIDAPKDGLSEVPPKQILKDGQSGDRLGDKIPASSSEKASLGLMLSDEELFVLASKERSATTDAAVSLVFPEIIGQFTLERLHEVYGKPSRSVPGDVMVLSWDFGHPWKRMVLVANTSRVAVVKSTVLHSTRESAERSAFGQWNTLGKGFSISREDMRKHYSFFDDIGGHVSATMWTISSRGKVQTFVFSAVRKDANGRYRVGHACIGGGG